MASVASSLLQYVFHHSRYVIISAATDIIARLDRTDIAVLSAVSDVVADARVGLSRPQLIRGTGRSQAAVML